jgi:hypothetical protein
MHPNPSEMLGGVNPAALIGALVVLLALLVVYLVLVTRAVIEMLRYRANSVLLVFAFLSLIPFPLILVLGVMILIIWRYHKKDLLAEIA